MVSKDYQLKYCMLIITNRCPLWVIWFSINMKKKLGHLSSLIKNHKNRKILNPALEFVWTSWVHTTYFTAIYVCMMYLILCPLYLTWSFIILKWEPPCYVLLIDYYLYDWLKDRFVPDMLNHFRFTIYE